MRRKENSLLSLQVKGGKVIERLQPLRSTILFYSDGIGLFSDGIDHPTESAKTVFFSHRIEKNPSDCVHSDGTVLGTVLFSTKKIRRNLF